MAGQAPNMDQFEAYFRRADLDQDGRISGQEAVSFFQGCNLPKQVLAQIWMHADTKQTGFLGRAEFSNALKLVTVAQSKRELTPDIVKAALYGPASAKIPAPQINLAALPTQSNLRAGTPSPQFVGSSPTLSQSTGIRGPHSFPPQQNQFMRPPRPSPPSNAFHLHHGVASQGMLGSGTMVPSRPPMTSSISTDLLGGRTGGSPAVLTSQIPARGTSPPTSQEGFGLPTSGLTPSIQPRPQTTAGLMQHDALKQNDQTLPAYQMGAKDSKASAVSGNGFASDPFGDVFSASIVQAKQNSLVPTSPASGLPPSLVTVAASVGSQSTVKSKSIEPLQDSLSHPHTSSQHQQVQSTVIHNQQFPVQNSSSVPGAAVNSASGQPQLQWPRMVQSDIQKYSKVFVEVDTDRDGKITGEQARNLFLSWRIPREVLKQVWDLSDQDNDSMLSLREFCVALYLMERYREGRSLPVVLPPNIMPEQTQLPTSGHQAAAYGNATWTHTSGLQQAQGMTGPRPVAHAGGKPPRPVPIPQPDEESVHRSQQKPRAPVLEKHLVDQLSTEEQNSLNSKFKELMEADKKVSDLEKDILDSREKIEYYRTKMQELILYKSRCDNRLNEITERVSTDKREVEALAKKYEDKYKQSGDVASKLTIEEATFRDIQEQKMELYRAIVKLEQDGSADDFQVRADKIQKDLEEQIKALNERCKTYGLRAKPTSLVELPFGWQPGIQGAAADWDEDWDRFEDEGFTFVKELTLDVKNIVGPPKTKISLVQKEGSSHDEVVTISSPNADSKLENQPRDGETNPEHELDNSHKEDGVGRSPPDSPASKNAVESPSKFPGSPFKKFLDSPSKKNISAEDSPRALETQSEYGGAESVLTEDRHFDEPVWGSFDTHYDTDVGWDSNLSIMKDTDRERKSGSSIFGLEGWGLNPIKTEPTRTDDMLQKKSTYTFDSVPSTPNFSSGTSPHADNMFQKKSPFGFADSVPSTPMSSYGTSLHADNIFQNKSPFGFADSVPSTPMSSYGTSLNADNMFQKKSPFAFDSVPSSPMYNSGNSPRRFNEGSEDHSFDNLSRFDSFNMHDSGPFGTESFSRFDSMRSTRDSEYDHGFFPPNESPARFDSFRSTADSEYNPAGLFEPRDSFARFDSMRSTRDSDYGRSFSSFDDADTHGSSDPFKTSIESQTPRRDSDSWKAF